MDKAELTSYMVLILTPLMAYFGFSEATQNALVGVVVGLIMLYIAIQNEKNPSDVLSSDIGEDGEDMDGQ